MVADLMNCKASKQASLLLQATADAITATSHHSKAINVV